jgi:hypothetical protein
MTKFRKQFDAPCVVKDFVAEGICPIIDLESVINHDQRWPSINITNWRGSLGEEYSTSTYFLLGADGENWGCRRAFEAV